MFCSKCGKEINDEAVVCIHCGCAVNNTANKTANQVDQIEQPNVGVGVMLMIVSFLIPIVGVILGIVFLCQRKTKFGTACLSIAVGAWIIYVMIFVFFL